MMDELFAMLQRLLPQHGLSRLAGRLARARAPWLRRGLIRTFVRVYGVDMTEAAEPDPDRYACFNDFFTRALRDDARPLDPDPAALLSPADGTVSQAGAIDGDLLLQAKGTRYRLDALAGPVEAADFYGGSFATIYLAPGDYHRVHLPAAGTLTATTAIPGAVFSVNARTEAAVTDLFCRNERLVCRFETDHGPMLVVLVGAMIVASIETVWGGPASPYRREVRDRWDERFERGAEIGRFLLGSTVIVCLPPGRVRWEPRVAAGQRVAVGERLGTFSG
jgi:phosphatidylserine decarboxylase